MAGKKQAAAVLSEALNQVDGDRQALRSTQKTLTYTELLESVSAAAAWLASINAKVLALSAGNSADWVILDLACQKTGVVCIPVPPFFSQAQVRHCIRKAGANVLVSDQADFSNIIDSETKPLESPAWLSLSCWHNSVASAGILPRGTQKITFTSGSTGEPKGVCLSLAHQLQVACSLAEKIRLNQPKHLCLLPLSTLLENIAGIYSPLLRGGTILIPDAQESGMSGSSGLNFQAFLGCLQAASPDSVILLPQILSVIVAACQQGWKAPESLQFIAVGGARVSPHLLQTAQDVGLPVYQGYGLSECASVVALNAPGEVNMATVGKPLPHTSIVTENGEIIVEGSIFLGYLGEPESWYPKRINSGDTGQFEGAYLSINGRLKNILISSYGRNISPEWVETELTSKPLISQCLVLGDDQPYIAALLSAPAQIQDVQIEQWIEEVNQSLPDYARVKKWHRLPQPEWRELLTANGRVRRDRAIRKFNNEINRLW